MEQLLLSDAVVPVTATSMLPIPLDLDIFWEEFRSNTSNAEKYEVRVLKEEVCGGELVTGRGEEDSFL
jgi:hypothetical protein